MYVCPDPRLNHLPDLFPDEQPGFFESEQWALTLEVARRRLSGPADDGPVADHPAVLAVGGSHGTAG